ncbi:MAG: glycosyltransferase [Candidatus Paceibacterota bacterium]
MQKTKICYIITKSNFGGAQKYVYELATSLDKNLFEVYVALGGNGILKQKLIESEIHVVNIPNLSNKLITTSDIGSFKFLYNFFNENHFDVVHLNSSKIGALGGFAARLSGVPKIIFTAHGWAFNEDRGFISKSIIKFIHWLTIMLCDQTIAVSENIKKQVFGWPFTPNKITIIHNGVKEIDFYDKTKARGILAEINQNINPDKFLVGTIAELHPIKGLDILVDAIKSIEANIDAQIVIIGEGHIRKELEEQIKNYNLENKVILLGFLDNAAKYLKAFDLFILPSRSEALALVVLEAGLGDVPVIATKVGGLPEIISNESFGKIVEPENYKSLAEAIKNSIENYEQTKTTAQNLKTRVEENFNYQKMLDKTISLY